MHSFAQSAAVAAYSERHEVGANGQEFDQGDIQDVSASQKAALGRQVLVSQVFCFDGGQIWRQSDDGPRCEESNW